MNRGDHMNRSLALVSVVVGAGVALTGCGSKKAATIASSASARSAMSPRPTSPATRAPSASVTVPGTVKIGTFCRPEGAAGKTSGGSWARCQKRNGDSRARWYPHGAPGKARAGQYCSKAGATATSTTGTKLVCSKKSGETRTRWHKK